MLPYTPVNWQDRPSTNTPLSAANLNRMDQGIKNAHDMLDAATNNQTAGTLVRRDSAGRARFADPSHNQDAATRGWVLQQLGGVGLKAVQRGTTSIPFFDGDTLQTVNVTISAVTLTKAFVIFSVRGTSDEVRTEDIALTARLTSATNLQFERRSTNGLRAITVVWEVVEFN